MSPECAALLGGTLRRHKLTLAEAGAVLRGRKWSRGRRGFLPRSPARTPRVGGWVRSTRLAGAQGLDRLDLAAVREAVEASTSANTHRLVAGRSGASPATFSQDYAAILRVMSDALLHVREATALDCAGLDQPADGSGRLTVRRSKTDQDAEGAVLFLGAPTMRAVRVWHAAAGIADGPPFRRLDRAGKPHKSGAGLATDSIRRIVRSRAQAAGIAGRISGHSLRVGSAQSIVRAGASTAELVQARRWQDARTATGYARAESARGAVARLRYGAGA